MTQQEAKELMPVIQAFSNGKKVQFKLKEELEWIDINNGENVGFTPKTYDYRIKPESKYRPFEYKEECLQEMMKHQPFGWIKNSQVWHIILSVSFTHIWINNNVCYTFEEAINNYKFADGTPFGIKEE